MAIQECAAANKLPDSTKRRLIYTRHEAETWQLENNQYIEGHFRTVSYSYRGSLASLGYLHNQTSNVYTHLIAAALFIFWATETYDDVLRRYPTSDFYDRLVFGIFFGCATFCFGSSALFHLFANHSAIVNRRWLLFDLYGVFTLISATIVSGTYYGFYCERLWWLIYSAGIVFITSLAAILCSMPKYMHSNWRNVRAILFVAIGFYGCLPMNHVAQKWGRSKANEIIGWNLMFLEGLSYFFGAVIYALRIPERWTPGTFDIWGSSHQIFHVCAAMGAVLHYKGLLIGFDYSHSPATRQC